MVYSLVKARVKFNYNFVVGCISLKYIKNKRSIFNFMESQNINKNCEELDAAKMVKQTPGKRKRVFTDEDIEWLKKYYSNSTREELDKRFPHLSNKDVRTKASVLGLKKNESAKNWTFKTIDREWLKENYATATWEEIDERFPNLDRDTIRKKAGSCGFKRDISLKGFGMTPEDEDWLREHYVWDSWEVINAKFPNLDDQQIRKKARHLGVKRDESVRWPMFSGEDDEWLKANYEVASWEEILDNMHGLTRMQILSHCCSILNLKRRDEEEYNRRRKLILEHYSEYDSVKDFVAAFDLQCSVEAVTAMANRLGVKRRQEWTEEEDRIIFENYSHMKRFELMKLLPGRSVTEVYNHLKKLGFESGGPGYKYTESDYKFIEENYMTMTDSEMGEVLHREAKSIKELRRKLKLYRRNPDEETNYRNLNRFFARQSSTWRRLSVKRCDNICFLTGTEAEDVHHLYSRNLIIRDTLLALHLKDEDILNINDCSHNLKNALLKEYKTQEKKHPFGVYLSEDVHYKFHRIYGSGDNTPEQFIEFVKNFFPDKLDKTKKYIQQNYNN